MIIPDLIDNLCEFDNQLEFADKFNIIGILVCGLLSEMLYNKRRTFNGILYDVDFEFDESIKDDIDDISVKNIEDFINNECDKNIAIFYNTLRQRFSQNELKNFYQNILTLNIKDPNNIAKFSMSLNGVAGNYEVDTNSINIGVNNYDVLFHELFHLASSSRKKKRSGFACNFDCVAINEGYTELMKNRYFPEYASYCVYEEQVKMVSYLDKLIGTEKMENFYLTSDLLGLIRELEKYSSREDIERFISNSDFILDAINFDENHNYANFNSKERLMILKSREEICEFIRNCFINKIKLMIDNNSSEITDDIINYYNNILDKEEKNYNSKIITVLNDELIKGEKDRLISKVFDIDMFDLNHYTMFSSLSSLTYYSSSNISPYKFIGMIKQRVNSDDVTKLLLDMVMVSDFINSDDYHSKYEYKKIYDIYSEFCDITSDNALIRLIIPKHPIVAKIRRKCKSLIK